MANKKNNDNASVIKILKAAEEIFSEKGFDGARVDDIASRAKVNKSHIYYHFESKEMLLEEITRRHIKEMLSEKEAIIGDSKEVNGDLVDKMLRNSILEILSKRKKFLGIAMIEIMKTDSNDMTLFKIFDPLIEDAILRFQKMGYELDIEEYKAKVFYFGIIPIIIHLTIGGKWADYNHIEKENLNSVFIESLKDIYSTYLHDAVLNKSKSKE